MATDPKLPRRKKIVVCCDGTGRRELSTPQLTNVSRISRCIPPAHEDGTPQVVYYQAGVGTDTGTLSRRFRQGFATGMFE